jgi:ABC-2 type transport system ATP-binding protein
LTVTQAVDCVDLSYQFATHLAVDHVNLSIAPGEMYGLLGPNGAGKTTTIRMITTLLTPAAGSVRVFGMDTATRPMLVRRVIGYVPQALSADANLTGTENVELFARLFDVPRRERKQRVADALDAMGLTEAADRLAGTYSGGMIRRLELAQSLISAPRLLVLDDPIARGVVWEYIAKLRDSHQMTVLMTTHYMDEAPAPHPPAERLRQCPAAVAQHRGGLRCDFLREVSEFPGHPADRLGAFLPGKLPPGPQPDGDLPDPPGRGPPAVRHAGARGPARGLHPAAPCGPASRPPWPAAPSPSGRPRSPGSPWYRCAPGRLAAASPRPPWPAAPRSARPPRPPRASSAGSRSTSAGSRDSHNGG